MTAASVESFTVFLDAAVEPRVPVPTRSRGRIVMLVDNSVTVDSRVQKQARSAAARMEHHTVGTVPQSGPNQLEAG